MFGKPIANATVEDVRRLVDEERPEGRHLEYKREVPLSPEQVREQRTRNVERPVDRAVFQGSGIGRHGRDELLEELVAFANADGGVLVLGMAETAAQPPRAAAFSPIPHVVALERTLRDAVTSEIEPRLPYAAVRAVPTEPDGSGLLLLEASASALAPHRVRHSRKATIRREDRCDTLTMPEIHDMVLRNARRFDAVNARLDGSAADFEPFVLDTLEARFGSNVTSVVKPDRVDAALDAADCSALGIRVTIVAHHDLGIPRLESLQALQTYPAVRCEELVGFENSDNLFAPTVTDRKVLGGHLSLSPRGDDWTMRHLVQRDGFVEMRLVTYDARHGLQAFVTWMLSAAGSVLGLYDNLRILAGMPSMPGEIEADIIAIGPVHPVLGRRHPSALPLPFRSRFPRCSVADSSDFDDYVNDLVGDLMNAGNMPAAGLPHFSLG